MLSLPANFGTLLWETLAWCSRPESRAQNYRSAEIDPDQPPHYWFEGEPAEFLRFYRERLTKRQRMVENYALHRRAALGKSSLEAKQHAAANGRLMVFESDLSTNDGLAEYASKGFFDIYNWPGWDTWICFLIDDDVQQLTLKDSGAWLSCLVCWIPEVLVPAVDAGINCNPEACELWADELGMWDYARQQAIQAALSPFMFWRSEETSKS